MSSERVKPYEERMEKTISYLQTDLQAVRAGRAICRLSVPDAQIRMCWIRSA